MLSVMSDMRTICGELHGTREFHEPELSTANEPAAGTGTISNGPRRPVAIMINEMSSTISDNPIFLRVNEVPLRIVTRIKVRQ